LLVYT